MSSSFSGFPRAEKGLTLSGGQKARITLARGQSSPEALLSFASLAELPPFSFSTAVRPSPFFLYLPAILILKPLYPLSPYRFTVPPTSCFSTTSSRRESSFDFLSLRLSVSLADFDLPPRIPEQPRRPDFSFHHR